MNVNLTPDLFRYVKSKATGVGYAGVSEFVREALREKRLREQRVVTRGGRSLTGPRSEEVEEHRLLVQEGVAALEQGDYAELDDSGLKDFFAGVSVRGRKRLAAANRK